MLPVWKGSEDRRRFPHFIECKASELIVYPDMTSISESEIENSNEFKKILNRIIQNGKKDTSLILMIRPNSIETFKKAERVVLKYELKYGFIPLPGFGKINFGEFQSSIKRLHTEESAKQGALLERL